ncbi:MAG: glycoside hydrolase family 3 protein [Spirochaetaceae bacterium]|nr:glycoside hydrolase family 3 protein [Spirochaetaceae bacterium]
MRSPLAAPRRRILLFSFLVFLTLHPLRALDFNSPGDPAVLAEALAARMSDEEALAQTFMFGWTGTGPSPLILDWIRIRRIGGIKVFGWNIRDLETLTETIGILQRASLGGPLKIPLLAATDQEGGMVRHVKDRTSDTPGNMAIGAGAFPEDAYYAGYYIGRELALLGINMNFAPVVDLATSRDSVLLGTRSFGEDPVQAGILGLAFMRGQTRAGIISTAKHFPGHGATSLDSHGTLPRIAADERLLWDRELVPYRMLIRGGLPAVMSGHLAFPRTPAGDIPASLAPWFLQTLLRNRMGFRGMVITDDLRMHGAFLTTGSLSRTARQALWAGNDMLLISSTPGMNDQVWTELLDWMKRERPFRERVRDAARRVLALKLIHLRREGAASPIPDPDRLRREIPDPQAEAFFQDLAARSVTVIKKEGIPLDPASAGRVLLAGRHWNFINAGRRAYPKAAVYSWEESANAATLRTFAQGADTVILCMENPGDLQLLESLRSLNKRTVVFSVSASAYPDKNSWVHAAAVLYSTAEESFIAGFSVLLGRINGGGAIP